MPWNYPQQSAGTTEIQEGTLCNVVEWLNFIDPSSTNFSLAGNNIVNFFNCRFNIPTPRMQCFLKLFLLSFIMTGMQLPYHNQYVFADNDQFFILKGWTNLIFVPFSEPNLLVRACNQLGQFLSHRETNLRYLALESMCLLATSEFSHEAVKKHQVRFTFL